MLTATVKKIRHITIIRCQGRMIVGENFATLRNAVMKQSSTGVMVLDLAGVRRVDAGGLGLLVGLRKWAEVNSIEFKLMNVMPKVQRLLKLTKLDRIFEYCSVRDTFELLCHAYSENGGVREFPARQKVMAWDPSAA